MKPKIDAAGIETTAQDKQNSRNPAESPARRKSQTVDGGPADDEKSVDEKLDEALKESFPASDPPSITAPGKP